MVRELITLNLGQAGLQLSQSVWQQYCAEHEISNDGTLTPTSDSNTTDIDDIHGNMNAFFIESGSGKYVPRNISIDTEPNVIDDIKSGVLGKLFYDKDLINGNEDCANNFARGKYTVGRDIIDRVEERIRKVYELSDNVEGFILHHAVGGGTGSGLGDLVLEKIRKYKRPILGFEIYPSERISNCVVEPYNAVLSTGGSLSQDNDNIISFLLDNEKLYKICNKNLDIKRPSYDNINRLIAKAVSSLTASIRFKGELNLDVSDLKTNLVPYPSLHFMLTSLSPILTPTKMESFDCNARTLTDQCFNQDNFYIDIPDYNKEEDKYLSALVMFRGQIQAKEANEATQWLMDNSKCSFVDWIPCGFKLCLNNKKVSLSNSNITKGTIDEDLGISKSSALMVGNNVSVGRLFENRLNKKFDVMYHQRAFVHHFVGEGLEEYEFDEAREQLGFLETDYLAAMNDLTTTSGSSATDDEDF